MQGSHFAIYLSPETISFNFLFLFVLYIFIFSYFFNFDWKYIPSISEGNYVIPRFMLLFPMKYEELFQKPESEKDWRIKKEKINFTTLIFTSLNVDIFYRKEIQTMYKGVLLVRNPFESKRAILFLIFTVNKITDTIIFQYHIKLILPCQKQ